MSEGPISQWWKSHEPAKVSTANAERVCFLRHETKAAYCGRKKVRVTVTRSEVKCADCRAALHADQLAAVHSSPDSGTRPDA